MDSLAAAYLAGQELDHRHYPRPAEVNGSFVRNRFDLNRLMLSTIDYYLAVDRRKAHDINVVIDPILMQILRTLEGCHRVGRKLIYAVSLVRTDRTAANDRQQKHKPDATDSASA